MEYKIKNASYVFWFFAVVSVIFSFYSYSVAPSQFTDEAEIMIRYMAIAIPCLFVGIALTLTLVSKALREITISTMNMLDEQKKNSK